MVDQILSISYVAAMDAEQQRRVLAQARHILERAPRRIAIDHPVDVWLSRRRP